MEAKKQRQRGENEQGAHESGLRGGFDIIVVGVIDSHVARKTLIARVSGLKISQAHSHQGMVAPHVHGTAGHALAAAGGLRYPRHCTTMHSSSQ
jgi:hypothetical protein